MLSAASSLKTLYLSAVEGATVFELAVPNGSNGVELTAAEDDLEPADEGLLSRVALACPEPNSDWTC